MALEEPWNRDLLITKEKRNLICSGKGYRQKDHETPTGGDTYENSVADDLESFYEDIKLGKRPLSIAWTYFSPELTLKEMELVQSKDEEYMRSFKLLNDADVNETMMKLSSSSSKYLSAYCRRKTIAIDIQNLPGENQESNSANKETFSLTIDLNTRSSGETEESIDKTSIDTVSSTEGQQLLCQKKISGRISFTYKQKLILQFMILVLVWLVLEWLVE